MSQEAKNLTSKFNVAAGWIPLASFRAFQNDIEVKLNEYHEYKLSPYSVAGNDLEQSNDARELLQEHIDSLSGKRKKLVENIENNAIRHAFNEAVNEYSEAEQIKDKLELYQTVIDGLREVQAFQNRTPAIERAIQRYGSRRVDEETLPQKRVPGLGKCVFANDVEGPLELGRALGVQLNLDADDPGDPGDPGGWGKPKNILSP